MEAASASQSTMPTQSSSSSSWVKGMPSQPATLWQVLAGACVVARALVEALKQRHNLAWRDVGKVREELLHPAQGLHLDGALPVRVRYIYQPCRIAYLWNSAICCTICLPGAQEICLLPAVLDARPVLVEVVDGRGKHWGRDGLRPKYRAHVGFTPEKKYDPVD